MSDLSEDALNPEETIEPSPPSSQWPMFITITLLIAALSLTGVMLLHYAEKRVPEEGAAEPTLAVDEKAETSTNQVEKTGFSFASIKNFFSSDDKPEAEVAEADGPTPAAEKEASSGGFKLFGDRGANVRWPKLKLTGFGTSTDGSGGFAIINNNQIHPGQLIEGKAKLVEVREHDVLVEYQGEQKSLTVDVKN